MYGGEFSYFLTIVVLAILGVLGLSNIIISKKPNARELIDKLAKLSGIVGIVAAIWGIYLLFNLLFNISIIARISFLFLISSLATAAVFIGLGFIFGFGLVASVLNEQARAKAEKWRQKLIGFQVLMGWVSAGLAAWWILARIFPRLMFF